MEQYPATIGIQATLAPGSQPHISINSNPADYKSGSFADSSLDPVVVCSTRYFALAKLYSASVAFDYISPDVAQDIKMYTRGRLRYALDCITDPASIACYYIAIGQPGGRYICLEACLAAWRTREAVKAEFVISLEGLGMPVALEGEYRRPASVEKRALTIRLFGQF
ncbi:Enoyl reductase LovC [Madurella mycetomatis]|uniref:Enoyl reductase LovC n=1 Tax=Madurella mycetomatis TaxID=100816 RepID=A0A175VPB5_9PEZI|nr:Enoyl reductase LovC [Madurella mycetomatis]